MSPIDDSPADSATARQVPSDAGIDLTLALQRMGNDAELLREMAVIFVQDAPGLLEQAANGLDTRQAEEAARAAHSLKGLASNFSASAADAAQAAEAAIRNGDRARTERNLETLQMFVARLIDELQRSVLSKGELREES